MDILPLTRADLPQWSALLAQTFQRQPQDMANLLAFLADWYPLLAYGAWDGYRLAGQYSCLERTVYLPAERKWVPVGMSLNMAVHPDYRGQGLVKKMSAPVYEQICQRGGVAGMGFSNREGVAVDRHSRGYGYQVVGEMQSVWVWLTGTSQIPPARLNTPFPRMLNPANSPESFLHLVDDHDHLRHRFTQHPFRQYHFAETSTGGVIYRPLWGKRVASLLFIWGEDLAQTLAAFGSALRQAGVYAIHTLISPCLFPLLSPLGKRFQLPYTRQPFFLTAKPLSPIASELLTFEAWACWGGHII